MRPVGGFTYSVVIPAHDAARTIPRVLEALRAQDPAPNEVIVVDDESTDGTGDLARAAGATVLEANGLHSAGGSRNLGWEAATGDVVVFCDSDVVPDPDWSRALEQSAGEFPGALIACARRWEPVTEWQWVTHLQIETPYLPRGKPRDVRFVSSCCVAVPRSLPLRWDESWGGEDVLFSAAAIERGVRLVFDPRWVAVHDHGRTTFADLRKAQRRLSRALARTGSVQKEGPHKRFFTRFPVHYFTLVRLLFIWRRLDDPVLRQAFVRNLPRLAAAEWTMGWAALRFVRQRPGKPPRVQT